MIENKYLIFTLTDIGAKTCVWNVVSKNNGIILGTIKWYGPWRQYCFYPCYETIYNKDCLNVIIEFIKENKDKRRN